MKKTPRQGTSKSASQVVTDTFELQKILPCLFLQTKVVYYKRQLVMYNLTLYESCQLTGDAGYSFMWEKTVAGRGSQEIGSYLWMWLENLPEAVGIDDGCLYSDSYDGQNCNFLPSAILMFLASFKRIKITHTYSEPRHSHMGADTTHVTTE